MWKEVPRFGEYQKAGIKVWHECMDVDLVVWVDDLDCLPEFRRLRVQTLRNMYTERDLGVADHQVEVFLFKSILWK